MAAARSSRSSRSSRSPGFIEQPRRAPNVFSRAPSIKGIFMQRAKVIRSLGMHIAAASHGLCLSLFPRLLLSVFSSPSLSSFSLQAPTERTGARGNKDTEGRRESDASETSPKRFCVAPSLRPSRSPPPTPSFPMSSYGLSAPSVLARVNSPFPWVSSKSRKFPWVVRVQSKLIHCSITRSRQCSSFSCTIISKNEGKRPRTDFAVSNDAKSNTKFYYANLAHSVAVRSDPMGASWPEVFLVPLLKLPSDSFQSITPRYDYLKPFVVQSILGFPLAELRRRYSIRL